MSVITEADELLLNTQRSLQSAIESLSQIVIYKVNGYTDFNTVYRNSLDAAFMCLRNAQKLLE
jgi:hypothetical protein